jgi:hypothetical protein
VDFCEVCKETIVFIPLIRVLPVIHGSSPAQNNVTVSRRWRNRSPGGCSASRSISLNYAWTIDGVTNTAFTSNSFPASFSTLGLGSRLVRVTVDDPTKLVRTDPLGKLWKPEAGSSTYPAKQTNRLLSRKLLTSHLPPIRVSGIPFTVMDPDNSVETLTVTATSSNTHLFAESDLQLSGSGSNRSITLTARCLRFGVCTITIAVSDGQNVALTSFTATITDGVDLHVFFRSDS